MARGRVTPRNNGKYYSAKQNNEILGLGLGAKTEAPDLSNLNFDRRTTQGRLAGRILSDTLKDSDTYFGYQGAGRYYNPKEGTSITDPEALKVLGEAIIKDPNEGRPGFVQWDVPTSSTNYQKPRTVAAGYTPNESDPNNGVMTVVFRDGTFYNYYQVSPGEWEGFHASYSKGKPWLNKAGKNQGADGLFVGKPRGEVSDSAVINPEVREALYRVARVQQQLRPPKSGKGKQTAQLYAASKAGKKPRKNGTMAVVNNAKIQPTYGKPKQHRA